MKYVTNYCITTRNTLFAIIEENFADRAVLAFPENECAPDKSYDPETVTTVWLSFDEIKYIAAKIEDIQHVVSKGENFTINAMAFSDVLDGHPARYPNDSVYMGQYDYWKEVVPSGAAGQSLRGCQHCSSPCTCSGRN